MPSRHDLSKTGQDKPETVQEREDRTRKAEQDQADRAEKAPLTGALSFHDVIRHLVHYGAPADPAARAELLAVVDDNDPGGDGQEQDEQDAPAYGEPASFGEPVVPSEPDLPSQPGEAGTGHAEPSRLSPVHQHEQATARNENCP